MTIAPLTRKQLSDTLVQVASVANALQRLPYKDAVEPLMAVHELQAALYQTLPGGFAGICTACEQAVGNAEPHETIFGEVTCGACLEDGADLPTVTIKREVEPA